MARPFTPSPAYPAARALYAQLCEATATASAALAAVPGIGSGAMGLTPDAVKASPVYRMAKGRYDAAFAEQRRYAARYLVTYRREIAADRADRRAALAAAHDTPPAAWGHARQHGSN